jgi:hypothetical protein
MAGGAAAGEEIEHDVAGAGGLLQQAFDQRQRLGVVEGAVAENFGDDAGAFLIGRRREAAFGFVIAVLEALAPASSTAAASGCAGRLVALELGPAKTDRAARPRIRDWADRDAAEVFCRSLERRQNRWRRAECLESRPGFGALIFRGKGSGRGG